jgi:hypothetical protein
MRGRRLERIGGVAITPAHPKRVKPALPEGIVEGARCDE